MTIPEYLLLLLAEEGAEITQRASKALRFGMQEIQPGQTETNAERLRQEVFDLTTVLNLLHAAGVLLAPDPGDMVAAIKAKREKIEKYMIYSEKMGRLVDGNPTLGLDMSLQDVKNDPKFTRR